MTQKFSVESGVCVPRSLNKRIFWRSMGMTIAFKSPRNNRLCKICEICVDAKSKLTRANGPMETYRSSVSEAGDEKREGPLKKYHVAKPFADRRYKVASARTYFYLNEASCERNMDIFIRCLESVAGDVHFLRFFPSSSPQDIHT